MSRRVFILPRCENLIQCTLTDVHQHVSVREALHRTNLVALHRWHEAVQRLAAVVLLQNLPVGHRRHTIIVELEPPCLPVGLDQRKVVTTMEITGVDEYTMQLVHPRLGLICSLIKELLEINLEGELVAVVDLWTM